MGTIAVLFELFELCLVSDKKIVQKLCKFYATAQKEDLSARFFPINASCPVSSAGVEECQPDLSLILCCYMDAPHLAKNVATIKRHLECSQFTYELIFINDCSPDNTVEIFQELAVVLREQRVRFQMVGHHENRGRGAGVQLGMTLAKGKTVGFIDVDLEHLPDSMPIVVDKILRNETDVVVAQRIYAFQKTHPLRAIASLCYRALVHRVLFLPVTDSEAGFKFFRTSSLQKILPKIRNEKWFWDTEIVHRCYLGKLRISEHPIVFLRNPQKKSTVKVFRDSLVYLRDLLLYSKQLVAEETTLSANEISFVQREMEKNKIDEKFCLEKVGCIATDA